MGFDFHCYIDEAGDEGFGKLRLARSGGGQSKWLLLGAIVTRGSNDSQLPKWRDEIAEKLEKSAKTPLHFKKLNHSERVAALDALSKKRFGACVICSNKTTIPQSGKAHVFKRKGYLYNYLVRYLLERITQACARAACEENSCARRLHTTFSRRGGTDYQSMRDYLELMRDRREVFAPVRSIDWSVLDPANISVENHAKKAGLQIADLVTSATSAALEPNKFGHVETRYAISIKERYLKLNGSIMGCGLTLIPPASKNPLTHDERAFVNDLADIERAPGS